MGLGRGEKIKPLGMIRVITTRAEPFDTITQEDVVREGFPEWTPEQFVAMLVDHYGVSPCDDVNRIEFEYV